MTMRATTILLLAFLIPGAVNAQTVTRSAMSAYNNANITSNGQGAITGPIMNNMLGQIINSMCGLAQASDCALPAGTANANLTTAEIWLPGHGISCNGTDETAAWNALFTAYPYGLTVHLPATADCVYSSLTWPAYYTVMGPNQGKGALITNSATLNANVMGVSDTFEDLTLTANVVRTAGSLFVMNGNGDIVERVTCSAYFICGTVGQPSNLVTKPTIRDLTLFSPVVGAGSGAIEAVDFSNLLIDGMVASGPAYPGQQPDFGLWLVNGDTAYIANTNITLHGKALLMSPSSGLNTYSVQIVNSDFDSAGTISGSVAASSCTFNGAGNVYETTMSNVWCGLSKGSNGMLLQPTGVVDGLHISNPMFEGNAGNGFQISSATVTNWDVKGGSASGNTGSAIYINAATTHGSITGGFKGNANGDRGANNYGFNINAAVDYLTILGNDFTGNTTGNYLNTGVIGTHNRISQNVGYNPIGPQGPTTVGASPATICAQFTDETLYFSQSATNTATVKLGSTSGQLVGTMSSPTTVVTVGLGPDECVAVTWTTTAPTYSAALH